MLSRLLLVGDLAVGRACISCGPGVKTCTSATDATVCAVNPVAQTFLDSSSASARRCVSADACPAKTYAATTGSELSSTFALLSAMELTCAHVGSATATFTCSACSDGALECADVTGKALAWCVIVELSYPFLSSRGQCSHSSLPSQ